MQLSPTAPIIVNGYDSENRMTSTQTAGNTRIDNRYDPLQRRVLKQVSTWDTGTSTWVLQKTMRFTYDGWNMIEEEQLQYKVSVPLFALEQRGGRLRAAAGQEGEAV